MRIFLGSETVTQVLHLEPLCPIGLYDSGLGGLTVVEELRRQMPAERVVYVADTARVPYGSRPPGDILAFSEEIVNVLVAARCKLIIVACNTSSALALPVLQSWCPVPILGLIEAGAEAACDAVAAVPKPRIGVVATAATVSSGAHAQAIAQRRADATVSAIAAPDWVPLIEAGMTADAAIERTVRQTLAPLCPNGVDALILGCTHYPHWRKAIQASMGEGLPLIDPAARVVARAREVLLAGNGLVSERHGSDRYLVSGCPVLFQERAWQFAPSLAVRTEALDLTATAASPVAGQVLRTAIYPSAGSSGIVSQGKH